MSHIELTPEQQKQLALQALRDKIAEIGELVSDLREFQKFAGIENVSILEELEKQEIFLW